MSSTGGRINHLALVQDGKNAFPLICNSCGSKILPKNTGTYEEIEYDLPCILQRRSDSESGKEPDIQTEKLTQFFRVEDKFDFDNAGFTKTVNLKIKFLCCVDCSLGPIGWHDTETQKSYVSLARVKHNRD